MNKKEIYILVDTQKDYERLCYLHKNKKNSAIACFFDYPDSKKIKEALSLVKGFPPKTFKEIKKATIIWE